MSKEEMQQQILDAITSGKIQVTNINFGDHVEHQHKIEKVEAGGVGFQIFEAHSAHSESKQVKDITPISSSVASEFDSDIPSSSARCVRTESIRIALSTIAIRFPQIF